MATSVRMEWEREDYLAPSSHELNSDYKQIAKDLLGEDEAETPKVMAEFKAALLKEDLPVVITDAFLLKYLRAGKMNVESAMQVVRSGVKYRQKIPLAFDNLCFDDNARVALGTNFYTIMPWRNEKGQRIIVIRPEMWWDEICPVYFLERAFYLCCDILAREAKSQVAGGVAIVDYRGYGKKQRTSWTLDDVKKGSKYQCHLVNLGSFAMAITKLYMTFLREDVKKKIRLHKTYEDLHKEVPAKYLPEELDGEMGPASVHRQQLEKALMKMGRDFDDFTCNKKDWIK